MIVQDILNTIKESEGYIENSLYLKSYDDNGVVYKFLIIVDENKKIVNRREIFLIINSEDKELSLEDRECYSWYYVEPAY